MSAVPLLRRRVLNRAPVNAGADYVLYWMIAYRRATWNYSLDRAVELARELERPLIVLEALRCDYRWASGRFHRFVLDGMAENARRFGRAAVHYYPYVEPEPGAGRRLLEALARHASVVITDDFPCFFLPRMVTTAARRLRVRLEQVDSNGILPLRAADRAFPTAYAFRRFLHRALPDWLQQAPRARPLARLRLPVLQQLPDRIAERWPAAEPPLLAGDALSLAQLPVDHAVAPVATRGGARHARGALQRFLDERLDRYSAERNQPEAGATSELSPYLHFGHISAHEILAGVTDREDWSPDRLAPKPTGSRHGWWGMSEAAEAFLDQLVTWRELGYNRCALRDDYGRYETLPTWARTTLTKHAQDRRPYRYDAETLEGTATHDPLWNAAQTQLVRDGVIHNYLRMLWGKKILEWSASPEEALNIMIHLNNKYAVDGRDPNSYSGIFWCLGLYDRAWGPERRIFGTVRYMSSESTARKVRVAEYLRRYGGVPNRGSRPA